MNDELKALVKEELQTLFGSLNLPEAFFDEAAERMVSVVSRYLIVGALKHFEEEKDGDDSHQ